MAFSFQAKSWSSLLRTTKRRDRLADSRVMVGRQLASLHFRLDVHGFLLSGQVLVSVTANH